MAKKKDKDKEKRKEKKTCEVSRKIILHKEEVTYFSIGFEDFVEFKEFF
jgi:hypothetical protein